MNLLQLLAALIPSSAKPTAAELLSCVGQETEAGKFEWLGSGAGGSVFKVPWSKGAVAMKVQGLPEPGNLKRIAQKKLEARALIKLASATRHVPIFYMEHDDWTNRKKYLFMELLEGFVTFSEIRKRSEWKAALNVDKLLALIRNYVEGLNDINGQGVFHAEINENNVMMHPISMQVKFIDFGGAKLLEDGPSQDELNKWVKWSLRSLGIVLDFVSNVFGDKAADSYPTWIRKLEEITAEASNPMADAVRWIGKLPLL